MIYIFNLPTAKVAACQLSFPQSLERHNLLQSLVPKDYSSVEELGLITKNGLKGGRERGARRKIFPRSLYIFIVFGITTPFRKWLASC